MTCKDCIHYEVCERKDGTSTYTVEDPSLNVVKEINFINCFNFKDRSKFIELPCKVGDKVYSLNLGNIWFDTDDRIIEETVISITIYEKNFVITTNGSCCVYGKGNIFLTKKEAEQALRERNNENSL